MSEAAIALALLIASVPDEGIHILANIFKDHNTESVRSELKKLCLDQQLLDSREVLYLLSRPEDFYSDLQLLRARYKKIHDAPPVEDCVRFPVRTTITKMLEFNRSYRDYLVALQDIHWDKQWLDAAISETDQLYEFWDKARDARTDYYYVTVRREALKALRDRIGHRYYYSGTPPHVPIWRFRRID